MMPVNDVMSEKKKALIAYKEKILQEMKYYDQRIEDLRAKGLKHSFYENADSSDSEDEFPLIMDCGPSAVELRETQAMLRTCLQATQELTSLQVLQAEVNVLVEDPQFEGEPPVLEPGVWREVTAECRVDLVPFSITFYVHQPERKFGPLSYRGLRAAPVKAAHEGELNRSVLPSVGRPSDAVEVLKSYAAAQRARRSTLARLADKFANTLYMEPMADGGYVLKCANLLEVSWTLQNRWSPIAPFHHRMKFDLEYMDESYIKSITQIHRQLSDPSIDTDERTLLLAKIINTCLEAQGPTQELYESMSSDPEVAQSLKQRRTTLDREPEHPGPARGDKDRQVMAPPRSLPKKAKPKGKENMAENRKEKLKRGNSDEDMNKNKKQKLDPEGNRILNKESNNKISENTETKQKNNVTSKDKENLANNKNNEPKSANKKKSEGMNKPNKDKNMLTEKDSAEIQGSDSNKLTKQKSDVASVKNIPNSADKNINKAKIAKEKSNLDKNDVASLKENLKEIDSDKNKNKTKITKEKSNDKLTAAKSKIDSAKNLESHTKSAKEKTNAEKGEKIKTVASSNKESKINNVEESTNTNKKADVENEKSNKKDGKSHKVQEKNLAKSKDDNIVKSKSAPNIKKKETAIKTDEANKNKVTNEKKTLNIKSQIKDAKATDPTIAITKEATKTKVMTKTKVINEVKESNNEKNANMKPKNPAETKSKELTKKTIDNAKIIKMVDQALKHNKDKKGLPTDKNKAKLKTTEVPENMKNQVQENKTKTVANIKNKVLPKENYKIKKSVVNDKLVDKNKESTIEKVVEKRKSVARKSNLADRIDDVAIKRPSEKPKIVDKIISGNISENPKSVAMKRKSNYDKNTDNASAKKRAVENEKVATNVKTTENNFQKATKSKLEMKFKSKLMPGSIKTHVSGNTKKVLSAGNIDKVSRIPQKKLSAVSEATLKKNPLRISPRKISSKFKPMDGLKSIQKTTSIPRLLKKPVPKT